MPPQKQGLELLQPWMEDPVVPGITNNFQQKMAMGKLFGVMWGREQFVVTSTVRRKDGMLLSATMDNDLQLRLKVACDEALESCKHELPMSIRRELTLELAKTD